MTGKGCVYTEVIERNLKENEAKHKFSGFAIMPLRKNLGVFYQNCLKPFFLGAYSAPSTDTQLEIGRGDQIRRPGVIICEGICKRIQESNFVIADVSLPNANVFYELGLAYGIGQKAVVIYHTKSQFGADMIDYLKPARCRAYAYQGLDPLDVKEFDVAQHIWTRQFDEVEHTHSNPGILLFEQYLDDHKQKEPVDKYDDDIDLDFRHHLLSAVGLSIDKIYQTLQVEREASRVIARYLPVIKELKDVDEVRQDANFLEIRRQMDNSYCIIVRTGKTAHPMAYFWLGYGHARGKNVIPITVIKNPRDQVDDLAFDIRSQRHMTFVEKAPELLETELEQSFQQMILTDFSEWSRKRFWDEVLDRRGEVYIFTGALHNKDFDREMIGDWDLRAVSELTSYFGRNQYRARIDTPVYAPEYANPRDQPVKTREFIEQLRGMIEGKNCILIASPEVNPLTEIVLGHIYGVPEDRLFSDPIDSIQFPDAIVTVKEKSVKEKGEAGKEEAEAVKEKVEASSPKKQCSLYREEQATTGYPRRGFASNQITGGKITERFISQIDPKECFDVYAHLAIVPNPFGQDPRHRRYIIILNGVSGPATFALTHVLTGGVNDKFVSYDQGFDPEANSEAILSQIFGELQAHQSKFRALECIIKVRVGPSQDAARRTVISTFDWRQILGWELDETAFGRVRVLFRKEST
jgi:hypothetical protein